MKVVKHDYVQMIVGRVLHNLVPALLLLCSQAWAATAPPMGVAGSFAVLGGATVTNTGTTTINGDMGVSPGTITGAAPVVNGTIHAADVIAQNAQLDLTIAYNNLAAQACTSGPLGATDLAAATLAPGVYCYSSTLANSGVLTLDAGGNANAVWVFEIGSTLTTGIGSSVIVINGGQASNVFWQVGSSATLDVNTIFAGNILALTSITLNAGATVAGRVLARNGTVTLSTNTVTLSPVISVSKSVLAFSDPLNGTTNPKAVPGAEMQYTITVTNSGYGVVDNNTSVVTDPVPANMSLCVSVICGNVTWTCSAACGLTYVYATNVAYSNLFGGGPPYNYVPSPDITGYDANVTGVRINPTGIFSGASIAGNPWFSLLLKMKIK